MKKFIYQCSKCGNEIELRVNPSYPPTCSKHTGGGWLMQLDESKSTSKPKYKEKK